MSSGPLVGIEKIRRDRLHTGMDILKILSDTEAKRSGLLVMSRTQIVYRANVTWKMLNELIGKLLNAGWITEHYKGKAAWCAITPDGLAALTSYRELRAKFDQEVSGLSEEIPQRG